RRARRRRRRRPPPDTSTSSGAPMTDPRPSQPRPGPAAGSGIGGADLSGIVLANDVRGRAGQTLTTEIARAFGAAFADHLDTPAMIVAHDMRLSSPELSQAVIDGAVR